MPRNSITSSKYLVMTEQKQVPEFKYLDIIHSVICVGHSCFQGCLVDSFISGYFIRCVKYLVRKAVLKEQPLFRGGELPEALQH